MPIHPAIRSLLDEIEGFRARSGMSVTAFGTLSLNDPKFVSDLHNGRTPSLTTIDKVRAFIRSRDEGVTA